MRNWGTCFRTLAFFVLFAATPAVAQQEAAQESDGEGANQLPPSIGSAIAGLNGLVSSTAQRADLGRSSDRLNVVRAAMTAELLNPSFQTGPLKFAGLTPDGLLCKAREDHAVEAADRSFVAAVSSSVQKTATPAKIESFSAAIGSLMQSYSLDIPEGKSAEEVKKGISDRCKNEVFSFAHQFYGAPTQKAAAVAGANQELSPLDFLSPVSALFSALNAIITPIVTNLASVIDENRRIDAIAEYFKVKKNRDQVVAAAKRLGGLADNFTTANRMMSLGRFSETLAGLRGAGDASKIDACKAALKTAESRGNYVALPGNANEKMFVPSDDFMRCYSKLWSQMSDQVVSMLKAADDYDQFADASGASAAAGKIANYLEKIQNPPALTLKDLWTSAVKLVAFADTVNKALSPDNQKKVKQAIANLAKLQ